MRSLTRVLALPCLFALLGVAGCQKINVEMTYTMNPGEVKIFVVDPPSREQNVSLAVTSSGPVDVYIASEADVNEANDKIKPPKNALASKEGAQNDTLTVKIPAKTGYGVALLNAKNRNTKVTVKLTGK